MHSLANIRPEPLAPSDLLLETERLRLRPLTEEDLDHFRREIGRGGQGLSSYPHPRLMPGFWEFPTVSMGLGSLTALYQARFNRYLKNREIDDTSTSRVWAFLGDGECDEPETLGALSIAAREKLDNLIFVVNCNLQRLDGPVRGNSKIVRRINRLAGGGFVTFDCESTSLLSEQYRI